MTGVAKPRHGIVPWPPVIYVAAIAASIVLGMLYPLPWIGDIFGDLLFGVGWVALFGV
ncbi:MAG: isoprenylcysteine carboxylmethyltransferase family protein, partial [Mesorhizobium sp.]